jgi:hypothetical protein
LRPCGFAISCHGVKDDDVEIPGSATEHANEQRNLAAVMDAVDGSVLQ